MDKRKENQMKSFVLLALFAALTLTSCVVSPGPPGYGRVMVSPLPAIVELGADPYYYQDGYYYFYQNNNWRYSKSRSGPWADLPRSHWPKEIRHRDSDRDMHGEGDRDMHRDDNRDRGRDDNRDRDSGQDYNKR
jgi:hypothetical protein